MNGIYDLRNLPPRNIIEAMVKYRMSATLEIGRKIFAVDELPQGALARYDIYIKDREHDSKSNS